MKHLFIRLAVGVVLLVIGFVAGRLFQHAKTGYHYEVREEREYASPMGPIRWRHVTESVGLPFLDPGTTIIEYAGRTIYKAQRAFQESVPFAKNIEASDKSIAWDDGDFRFHLTVERLKKGEPEGPANASQPVRSDTNSASPATGSRR